MEYSLNVDNETQNVRSLMFHIQDNPYPGGHRYSLRIQDQDVMHVLQDVGPGVYRDLSRSQSSSIMNRIFSIIGLKFVRGDFTYWVNTIDYLEVGNDTVLLQGRCSPQVRG
jgi:hypothetical protein